MNILEIIAKKRDKKELTKEEIHYFIDGYTNGQVEDYQAAALIMAIYLNGMNDREITDLTLEMANSGEVLDLSKITNSQEIIVDKHSTGGVGDKVSIILCPLIASMGIKVAKMSGRGLGFTGGTVDKLESIPGYKTNIEMETFIENVKNIGVSMISQTLNLAPADKKIYALRNSISCVESIPLIASSIMSKKIASGADKIVLDVTVGSGAFMKTIEDARKLARQMIRIGKLTNRETVCVLTNMDEPLGYSVGNNLEVIEAIEFLKGNMPEDLKQVVLELANNIMKLYGKNTDDDVNKKNILENIKNGKAYRKFVEMVKIQGGDISVIEDISKFHKSSVIKEVIATKSGYVQSINAEEIGRMACSLGAGRVKKTDDIDNTVGLIIKTKVGEQIKEGDILAEIHANDLGKAEEIEKQLLQTIVINKNPKKEIKTILEIMV